MLYRDVLVIFEKIKVHWVVRCLKYTLYLMHWTGIRQQTLLPNAESLPGNYGSSLRNVF
jgi:hypothetical protein